MLSKTLAIEIANLQNLPVILLVTTYLETLPNDRERRRVVNSTIHDCRATFEPLLTNERIVPPNFPQDYSITANASILGIISLD